VKALDLDDRHVLSKAEHVAFQDIDDAFPVTLECHGGRRMHGLRQMQSALAQRRHTAPPPRYDS